jgi:hypothetical protein
MGGIAQQNFQSKYYPFDNLFPAVQVDLNNDGIPDFIAETRSSQIQELLSIGSGNYVSKTLTVTGSGGGYPIASGDLDKDGKADVIFWPTGIACGNGSGGFSSSMSTAWQNNGFFAQAVVADFNSDAKPDFALAYQNQPVFPGIPVFEQRRRLRFAENDLLAEPSRGLQSGI